MLIEAGFDEEGFGLGRTLIEIAFTVRYITNQSSEARAGRFVDFFAKEHEQWAKVIAKHYPQAALRSDGEHQEMMAAASQIKDPHNWTGRRDQTKEMATEPPAAEEAAGEGYLAWEFDYEALYKWTSQYVHVTPSALERHALEPGSVFRIAGGAEQVRKGGPALFNVVIFLDKIWLRVAPALGIDSGGLASEFNRAIDVTKQWHSE